MKKINYREIGGYKYELVDQEVFKTDIFPFLKIKTEFICLDVNGKLTIEKCYAWDGPSGPTIDTKSFMRGALVHDAFYQLIREGYLDVSYKKPVDKLLRKMIIEDGMSRIFAWYVWKAVVIFGGAYLNLSASAINDENGE